MIIFFFLLAYVLILLNGKFLNKDNNNLISVLFGLLSPVFLFIENNFGLLIFNLHQIELAFVVLFSVLSSLYTLYCLINEKESARGIDLEYVMMALVLVNLIPFKIIALLLLEAHEGVKLEGARLGYFPRLLALWALIFLSMHGQYEYTGVFIIILTTYYSLDKIFKIDLTSKLLGIGFLFSLVLNTVEYSPMFYGLMLSMLLVLLIKLMYLRLIPDHQKKIQNTIKNALWIEKMNLLLSLSSKRKWFITEMKAEVTISKHVTERNVDYFKKTDEKEVFALVSFAVLFLLLLGAIK
ncbi:MAG: hypothetical protein HON90_10930 [Halobacteriovoraceae bacterium]|jgi:hypothetical protein|nr:hypothetical protein [Halobacteriovoraceae bacterium]